MDGDGGESTAPSPPASCHRRDAHRCGKLRREDIPLKKKPSEQQAVAPKRSKESETATCCLVYPADSTYLPSPRLVVRATFSSPRRASEGARPSGLPLDRADCCVVGIQRGGGGAVAGRWRGGGGAVVGRRRGGGGVAGWLTVQPAKRPERLLQTLSWVHREKGGMPISSSQQPTNEPAANAEVCRGIGVGFAVCFRRRCAPKARARRTAQNRAAVLFFTLFSRARFFHASNDFTLASAFARTGSSVALTLLQQKETGKKKMETFKQVHTYVRVLYIYILLFQQQRACRGDFSQNLDTSEQEKIRSIFVFFCRDHTLRTQQGHPWEGITCHLTPSALLRIVLRTRGVYW